MESTVVNLRGWQARALDALERSPSPDFLAVATPGAGKTTFALTAAALHLTEPRRFAALESKVPSRVVVVAPTQHLKTQWAAAALRLGLQLEADWTPRDPGAANEVHGIVTTYQQIGTSGADLARYARGAVVILDEVHHAGDERAWGDGVRAAFDGAARRISLSGTPFRSDDTPIPFVHYHLGIARPDFEYGYADALVDGGVVRPVFFPRFGGEMEWVAADGSEMSASFDDALIRSQQNERLRVALSLDGEFLSTVVGQAHSQLITLRREHPAAGGLVIAMDQDHAKAIARLFRARIGVTPVVATSDDPMASAKIAGFAASDAPWIVAVRMVSEGVDIPRLRIGVFATNTTTELFFRQAVGRLVRWQTGSFSQSAFMFIPDDPRLRQWATDIAVQRRHSLIRESVDDADEMSSELDDARELAAVEDDRLEQMSLFSVISARADAVDSSLEGLENASVFAAQPGHDQRAAEVGAADGSTFELSLRVPPPPAAGPGGAMSVAKRRRLLREANSEAVGELARFTDRSHRELNFELNRTVGIVRIADATVDQLERRLVVANRMLRRF